jgi:signal transduction histidine kinase
MDKMAFLVGLDPVVGEVVESALGPEYEVVRLEASLDALGRTADSSLFVVGENASDSNAVELCAKLRGFFPRAVLLAVASNLDALPRLLLAGADDVHVVDWGGGVLKGRVELARRVVVDRQRDPRRTDQEPRPTLLVDGTSKILVVNASVGPLYDRDAEQLGEHRLADFDLSGASWAAEPSRMRDGDVLTRQRRHTRKDGHELDIEETLEAIGSGPGRTFLVKLRDLTARAKLRERIRDARTLGTVGSLSGAIAHDLNNQLTVILSYTSLALDDLDEGNPLREDLEQVRAAGEQATLLARQLLSVGKPAARRERRTVDVGESLKDMEKLLRRLAGSSAELALAVTSGFRVNADAGQLLQAVSHLVLGARDDLRGPGEIVVDVARRVVEANVSANGNGNGNGNGASGSQPPAGRFVVLGVTAVPVADAVARPEGDDEEKSWSASGVASVHAAVAGIDGQLVVSQSGTSTRYEVLLREVETSPESVVHGAPVPRGEEVVLLVEADPLARRASSASLRRSGYRVVEAENAGDALLAAEEQPVHVLVTDLSLARLGGRRLAARISRMQPRMRVVYMGPPHETFEPGEECVTKPITPDRLVAAVRRVLGGGAVENASASDSA